MIAVVVPAAISSRTSIQVSSSIQTDSSASIGLGASSSWATAGTAVVTSAATVPATVPAIAKAAANPAANPSKNRISRSRRVVSVDPDRDRTEPTYGGTRPRGNENRAGSRLPARALKVRVLMGSRRLLLALAAVAAAFHLWSAGIAPFTALVQRPVHLALMAAIGLLAVGGVVDRSEEPGPESAGPGRMYAAISWLLVLLM